MIIFWGAPAPLMGVYGKGGGGAEGYGMGGGGAEPGFYGIGGGGDALTENIPEAAPSAEEVPAVEVVPPTEMAAPEAVEGMRPLGAESQTTLVPEPLTGSGPILGVRSPQEQEISGAGSEMPLRQPPVQAEIPFNLIKIILAFILVVTAIPAWLIKKK